MNDDLTEYELQSGSVEMNKIFAVTEDHIRLIQRLYFHYENDVYDTGAPAVGQKRPYGNSDVLGDVAETVRMKPEEHDEEWGDMDDESRQEIVGTEEENDYLIFSEIQKKELLKIHKEVTIALQICSSNLSFKPGRYRKDGYGHHYWKRVR